MEAVAAVMEAVVPQYVPESKQYPRFSVDLMMKMIQASTPLESRE